MTGPKQPRARVPDGKGRREGEAERINLFEHLPANSTERIAELRPPPVTSTVGNARPSVGHRSTAEGSGSSGRPAFPRVDQPLDLGKETVEIDWFCLEFVAADGERLFAIASHRVRGQRDDRNVAGRGGGLQTPRRLPAVDLRQVEVHQN